MNKCALLLVSLFAVSNWNGAALAADWGYDEKPKPVQTPELKAGPAQSLQPGRVKAAPAKPSTQAAAKSSAQGAAKPKPSSVGNPFGRSTAVKSGKSSSVGKGSVAVEDWIELYELAAKEPITDEQKDRFRKSVAHKLTTDRAPEVAQIVEFWPEVRGRIKNNDDGKAAFHALFRALLRYVAKSKNVSDDDATVLSELLGPERIAVPGDPPLTEDSVDAYGDMACFLYEQAHPGKTVDAIDNRTVFASVIARKYTDAPTAADKRAMANFSLTWSKFKVMWLAADEADRKALFAQVSQGKPPASAVHDSLVSAIFAHGPWHSTQ